MRSTPMLLAMLPTALAVQLSELAYSPPEDLAMKAMSADNSCVLPKGYIIKDFKAKSNDTGKILSSLDFTFIDDATKVTTICHFNSTSKSTTPPGLTPRFACENGEVKFIWEDNDKELWMIERVCSEGDGYGALFPCFVKAYANM